VEGKPVVPAEEVAGGGGLVAGLHAVADDEDDVVRDGCGFPGVGRAGQESQEEGKQEEPTWGRSGSHS